MRQYAVRAQASDGRTPRRLYTTHTEMVTARTYSQARWWGTKLLRWRGVPFVRVSLRCEPERQAHEAEAGI